MRGSAIRSRYSRHWLDGAFGRVRSASIQDLSIGPPYAPRIPDVAHTKGPALQDLRDDVLG
jgi:hypothetical protein